MVSFRRNSRSMISNWWWTVDKVLVVFVLTLIAIGAFLNFSASPAVAERIGVESFHFVKRQLLFTPIALGLLVFLSMLNLKTIRRIAVVGFILAIGFTIMTLFLGEATKGASRWIRLFGFAFQPSEFIKPCFAVTAAWLFDAKKKNTEFPGNILSTALFCLTLAVLLMQPDVGMAIVVSLIWVFQFFLAGLSLLLVGILGISFIGVLIFAYFTFSHVQIRVQQFLSSENNLSYQVKKSLQAFEHGNIFGTGPGEGVAKLNIPDAHTDFIFAVAGEEIGILLCLLIVILFAGIVIRSMMVSMKDNNLFVILAAAGLAASFGIQSIINMASTLHLMPTKGMTLPFISYGGSSLLATSLGIGMLLAITRKNVSAEDKDDH